jgi:hypothetical protein
MENFRPIEYHKTRDFSNKMSATMEFVRQNFKALGKSILFIAGPPVLLASLLLGSFFKNLMSSAFTLGRTDQADRLADMFNTPTFWLQLVVMFVFIMVSTIATIATINNYIILYEEKQSNKIEVAEVWERVRATFWMYMSTAILFTLLAIVVYVLMVVPIAFIGSGSGSVAFVMLFVFVLVIGMIYLVVSTSLLFIVRGYERIGFFQGLARSMSLVYGKWWSTFGLIMVLYLIVMVSSYVFMIPYYVVTFISAMHDTSVEGASQSNIAMDTASMVFLTLYYLCQMILYTFPNVGIAFQYFNLVERKEARGLMAQIQTLGQDTSSTSPTTDEHY